VRLIGFPAGGGADIVARILGRWLSERLGQEVIIENKPGGWSKGEPMCRSARREIVVGSIKDMVTPNLIIPQVVIPARIFATSVGGPSCGLVMQALWEAWAGSDSQQATAIRRTLH
jgi:hypothetical protein